MILRGLKLRRFTLNQINLHKNVSQNQRKVINGNAAYLRAKTPTHITATYAITNFHHKSLELDSQGIGSKILVSCHFTAISQSFHNQTFSFNDNGHDKLKGWLRDISSLRSGTKIVESNIKDLKKVLLF